MEPVDEFVTPGEAKVISNEVKIAALRKALEAAEQFKKTLAATRARRKLNAD